MTNPFDQSAELAQFSGTCPVFPLPEVVLFPNVILPLHIFEPRYREMTESILRTDRFIALAMLTSGADPQQKRAPIHETLCLGRVVAEERLEDGRYHIVVQGLARATVEGEHDREDLPYRLADLSIRESSESTGSKVEDDLLRHEAILRYRKAFPNVDVNRVFEQLMGADVPLGVFCDVLANTLKYDPEFSQSVLEETDTSARMTLLLDQINRLISGEKSNPVEREFPPPFSTN